MCSDVMRASRDVRTQANVFAQAELYLSKLTASHFNALNTKIANQNVLERMLIAMLGENMAVSNENFKN